MTLKEWRSKNAITLAKLATLCGMYGVNPARDLHRYENGSRQTPVLVVEKIVKATKGMVTAQDMHETRLDWLRANRPNEVANFPTVEVSA
ncbi:helix-turn-helix domain-containing protein [Maritalea porphyrae]|uniref:helix-turn-helix domain-containing protein n=1 Tax=Maritalea porphyrae TaxID=880732 RepID=UPI0022AE8787|nr:helix-turn-helix transcriptional regulator [Maritalea porphyrae]MCZ4274022.1 helix-turn-helix transcriptional regulator [Maritalea porphyrae]